MEFLRLCFQQLWRFYCLIPSPCSGSLLNQFLFTRCYYWPIDCPSLEWESPGRWVPLPHSAGWQAHTSSLYNNAGVWPPGLVHAEQMLYYLSYILSPALAFLKVGFSRSPSIIPMFLASSAVLWEEEHAFGFTHIGLHCRKFLVSDLIAPRFSCCGERVWGDQGSFGNSIQNLLRLLVWLKTCRQGFIPSSCGSRRLSFGWAWVT